MDITATGSMAIGGRTYRTGQIMRSGQFFAVPSQPAAEPRTTSIGEEIATTITIYETEPVAGDVRHYELEINGEIKWSGMGNDRADALLNAILAATGQEDELPDN
jgi:hypothetical protein